jgi:hypoxanthine phosphoribosyltransferase
MAKGILMKKIKLTAADIENAAIKLVKKLRKYKFKKKKTLVLGIGRGGLIPAQYVAYGLGIRDIGVIQSKLYEGDEKNEAKMEVSGALLLDYDSYDTIIVVDDLVDTGTTIDVILELLDQMSEQMREPSKEEILLIPAVLYSQKSKKIMKKEGVIVGQFIKKKDEKSLWLDFPWNLFVKGADS